MSEPIICPRCKGQGFNISTSYFNGRATCLLCNGVGKVVPVTDEGSGRRYKKLRDDYKDEFA